VFEPGKRLFRPGRGLAALAVSAMLVGGVAFAVSHGATATYAQTPAATGTAAAPPPPPPPPPPPSSATKAPTTAPPPPPPPSSPTKAATAAPTAKPPVASPAAQAPKPAVQAQAPAAKPATVQLPNTGTGGVTGTDSSPLLPAAAGLGAIVLVAGGAFALRSRRNED
jgi:LPXTG-motif cell wall-anchored protein